MALYCEKILPVVYLQYLTLAPALVRYFLVYICLLPQH